MQLRSKIREFFKGPASTKKKKQTLRTQMSPNYIAREKYVLGVDNLVEGNVVQTITFK